MRLRHWLTGGALVTALLALGCSRNVSGQYVNATGTSIIRLNTDGSGDVEVKLKMFEEKSSPYDTHERFLYKVRGSTVSLEMIDSKTGKVYVPSSKAEAEMMRPLAEGTISSDGKTLQIIGDTFTRQ
ncbi:MAG: hypothetical protein QM758_14760 [Armatimonas sp.]